MMYKDDDLRLKIKLLKAKGIIYNYVEMVEYLDITDRSFYEWLRGAYNLSYNNKKQLHQVIENLWED